MAQTLERIKTFLVMLTKNDNVEIIDNNDIDKEVKAIRAQESGRIEKLEDSVGKANIPLEEGKVFVDKAYVNEKEANEKATRKQAGREKQQTQRGE